MYRWVVLAITLCGCERWAEQPEVRTYGVFLPLCIILCEAAVETVDADDGNASGGSISQSPAPSASNAETNDNTATITATR